MKVAGTFNGTGADVYLCVGFIPDEIFVFNYETTNDYQIAWNILMQRSGEFADGYQIHTGTTYRQITALTKGNGITPYFGGTVLASGDVGTTTYGEGVFLKPDNRDYRYYSTNAPHGVGDAVAVDIDTWTLDTAANHTGHFNEDVTGTYIGEGSKIIIDGREYTIQALTATQGEAANEVTLSHSVASGEVQKIGGMYDMRPMVAGEIAKDGFLISNTTVNVNDALIGFIAEKWDI